MLVQHETTMLAIAVAYVMSVTTMATTTIPPPPPDCPSDLFIKLDAESDARRIKLNWTLHYNTSAHPYFQLQDFEFYVFHDEIRIFDHVHVNYQDVDKNLTAGVKHRFCIGVRIIDQGRDCPVGQKRACKKAALEAKERNGTGLTSPLVPWVVILLITVVAIISIVLK